ncbi:MAG: hypothetical protein AAF549_09400, partial [Pseudomonadota bacterium]
MTLDNILKKVRQDLKDITPYQSARMQYQGDDSVVFLDANEIGEQPYIGANNLNRYIEQQPQNALTIFCGCCSIYRFKL